MNDPLASLLEAVHFAAVKHRDQRRKGEDASPYINHPIEVAMLLATEGGVSDEATLQAAVLHDTIEDTETTSEELRAAFGARVCGLVEEVSDDKTLAKERRKELQIEHSPHLSEHAKLIKLADKICNVRDVTTAPPDWPLERRVAYLGWAEQVVAGLRGVSPALEKRFDETLAEGRRALS